MHVKNLAVKKEITKNPNPGLSTEETEGLLALYDICLAKGYINKKYAKISIPEAQAIIENLKTEKLFPEILAKRSAKTLILMMNDIFLIHTMWQKYKKDEKLFLRGTKFKSIFGVRYSKQYPGANNLRDRADIKKSHGQDIDLDKLIEMAKNKYPDIDEEKLKKERIGKELDFIYSLWRKFEKDEKLLMQGTKFKTIFFTDYIKQYPGANNLQIRANKRADKNRAYGQDIDLDKLIELAKKKHPDIDEEKLEIKRSKLIEKDRKERIKKELDFIYSLWQKFEKDEKLFMLGKKFKTIFLSVYIKQYPGASALRSRAYRKFYGQDIDLDKLIELAKKKYPDIDEEKLRKKRIEKELDFIYSLWKIYINDEKLLLQGKKFKTIFNNGRYKKQYIGAINFRARANQIKSYGQDIDLDTLLIMFFYRKLNPSQREVFIERGFNFDYRYKNELDKNSQGLAEELVKSLYHGKNGFIISSYEIATHSRNHTCILNIDNTQKLLAENISESEFFDRWVEKSYFIKAYNEQEAHRAKREADYSKEINKLAPGLILGEYEYLGTKEKDNKKLFVRTEQGKSTHFLAAELKDGQTLSAFIENLEKDQELTPKDMVKSAVGKLAVLHDLPLVLEKQTGLCGLSSVKQKNYDVLFEFINKKYIQDEHLTSFLQQKEYQGSVHFDAHLENFWVDNNNSVTILDLEDLKTGSVFHDLVYLLNMPALTDSDRLELLADYWQNRGIKKHQQELKKELKYIDELYLITLTKYLHRQIRNYYSSINKAKECRQENLGVLFEQHIKDAKKALSNSFYALQNLQHKSNVLKNNLLAEKINSCLVELDINYQEYKKLADLYLNVSCLDDNGNIIKFRSAPERIIAKVLKNLLPDTFSLLKGAGYEQEIDGAKIDFTFTIKDKEYALEYHPTEIERLSTGDYESPDEVINQRYYEKRNQHLSGHQLIHIPEYPLTSEIFYTYLKQIMPQLTEKHLLKAWTTVLEQIEEFENEYEPDYQLVFSPLLSRKTLSPLSLLSN